MLEGWRRRRAERRTRREVAQLRPLVGLTQRFLAGDIDERTYCQRQDGAGYAIDFDRSLPLWEIWQGVWGACEAYVDDSALRDDGDVGPDELREAARRLLGQLAAVSPALVEPPPRPRSEVLDDLLGHEHTTADLLDELRGLPWDSEELVVLRPGHLLHVLELREHRVIDDAELEAWAEAVEVRDDIGRDDSTRAVVDQAVHELANPTLFPTRSPDLVARLTSAHR